MAFEVLKNPVNKVKIQFLCLQQTFKEHLLYSLITFVMLWALHFLTPQKKTELKIMCQFEYIQILL